MIDWIKKLVRSRQFYLSLMVFAVVFAMVLKLFNLQIVNGNALYQLATRGTYSYRTVEAPRGKIYDRNGKLIAFNRTGYNVQVFKNNDIDMKQRDKMYLQVLEVLARNGDTFENLFSRYITEEITFGTQIDGVAEDPKDAEQELQTRKDWLVKRIDDFLVDESKAQKEAEQLETAREIFDYFRTELYKIDEAYSDAEAYKIMAIRYSIIISIGRLSNKTPFILAKDVSEETMSEIETRHAEFPGVSTEEVYFRQYNDPRTVAHILGYVRGMSEQEYKTEYTEDKGYSPNDLVGKGGIEKEAESILRGTKGLKTIYVDKDGREIGGESLTPPVSGDDIYLTIDLDLQKASIAAMQYWVEEVKKKKDNEKNFGDCVGGAVVVMNAKSGELLASVSYPDFDPNIFLAPSSNEAAQDAIRKLYDPQDNTLTPGVNRAIQGLYPPGSIFKPLVTIAALETGAINTHTHFFCKGSWEHQGTRLGCLGHHGNLAVVNALGVSCNVFFYEAAIQTKIDALDEYAKLFGLGEKTGLELKDQEYVGNRSNEETMRKKDPDLTHIWSDVDTAQTSIGQLYNQFTPVQLARYAAALGNGGNLINAHLIQKTVSAKGTTKETAVQSNKIDKVSATSYQVVQQGMLQMIDTASSTKKEFDELKAKYKAKYGKELTIAGKTGTPETGEEKKGKSSHGTFIGYAPADNPEVAVAVVLERGVWGYNAAHIACDVLEEYFGLNEKTETDYTANSGTPGLVP